MADQSSTTLAIAPPMPANTYLPIATATVPPGTPLAPNVSVDSEVVAGRANSVNTAYLSGLASAVGVAGEPVRCQYAGPLTLTAAQWAEIIATDSGVMIKGVPYYLSQATAGKLTKTAPGSGLACPVGIALSPLTLLIQISFPHTGGS